MVVDPVPPPGPDDDEALLPFDTSSPPHAVKVRHAARTTIARGFMKILDCLIAHCLCADIPWVFVGVGTGFF